MASGRDDGGGSRQDRSRPHLPRGGVGSRVVGSICGRRQAASCARLCSRYGGGGKGSLDPASGNRRAAGAPCELCSLLELSSLDPGLGARAQGEWRAASIARGSRRTRSKKRSGWDSASVGHLVQTCVKGPYLYLSVSAGTIKPQGRRIREQNPPRGKTQDGCRTQGMRCWTSARAPQPTGPTVTQ